MKKLLSLLTALSLAVSSSMAFANKEAIKTESEPTKTVMEQPIEQKKINLNQVNLNTASAAELQDKLVGIGAKKAQAIIDYRTKNGNFVSLEQLTEVSGIGKATLEKNRDRIVLE